MMASAFEISYVLSMGLLRHIIGLIAAFLFSVLGAVAMPMASTVSHQAEFFPLHAATAVEHTNVHFAARAPPITVPSVAITGGVTAMHGGAFVTHDVETQWASLNFGADLYAPNRGVQIDEGKFDYLFGRVTSNPHNTARSQQLQSELGQIGIWDTPSGRQTLTSHFDDVAADPSNVLRTYTETRNGVTQTFQVRESLLAGPGGFVRLESTFETMADGTSRFITTIPYR